MRELIRLRFTACARVLVRWFFRATVRVHVVYLAEIPAGGFILASNHISHFDPPVIGAHFARYVDWLAMEELFRGPVSALLFDLLGAFRVSRDGTDRTAIRTAAKRLAAGRVVGVFPEGGIRAGNSSVLEGAPMWSGAAMLSFWTERPILPCVIIGTDRLYRPLNWFRRVPVWVGIGPMLQPESSPDKREARASTQARLSAAFVDLKNALCVRFNLTPDDLPTTPQVRKREDRIAPQPSRRVSRE